MYRILDMFHFPQQSERGFVYFRDDDQLFVNDETNSGFYPFANENSIHFPLPESGPHMEKVVFIISMMPNCDSLFFED